MTYELTWIQNGKQFSERFTFPLAANNARFTLKRNGCTNIKLYELKVVK